MRDIFKQLRETLVPQGTAPVVPIGFNDSGLGGRAFYDAEFIQRCINDMEARTLSAVLDPLSDLEKLAFQLLLSSAYIETGK